LFHLSNAYDVGPVELRATRQRRPSVAANPQGGVIRLLFDKFQEFGSARQVVLWVQDQALQLPVIRRNNSSTCKIEWRPTAYHTVLQILTHPVYAGAYVFGRTTQRTRIVDGRARKTTGHSTVIPQFEEDLVNRIKGELTTCGQRLADRMTSWC
jgi:Recombinase